MREDKFVWAGIIGVMIFWVLSVMASLSITGLVIYCLWRVATHPW